MNFQGKAILVYLEEDNIQRAYFRVRPLMTQDGPLGAMETVYPDDGFMRIVPDRNEQHTFKERMRSMCGLCLVDLRRFQPDANKIRTNKNYSPARGETNQFIVYSDAVRALQEDLLFQVVADADRPKAYTPYVYIRSGANIQGPFRREDGFAPGETRQVPPDSAEIHAVSLNDQELLFYWPKREEPAAEKPAEKPAEQPAAEQQSAPREEQTVSAHEQIQAMDVEVSKNANKLREEPVSLAVPAAAELQNAKPLSGTKLYQAPQRPAVQRRAHNSLMEVVERERYVAKYEAPGATLLQAAELKEVNNPADAFKRALQSLWQTPETQRQAMDVLMNQPGLRQMLSKALTKETTDLTLAAMQGQLQEMEAERLMTLMQLDDAKKNLAAVREEALGKLTAQEQKKLDALTAAQEAAKAALDDMNKQIEPIRAAAQESLNKLESDLGARQRFILPVLGGSADRETLIARTEAALKAAGFLTEDGDAEALLTAYALCGGGWTFCADTEEDALCAFSAFAAALGVKTCDVGLAEPVILPGGDAPVLLLNAAAPNELVTGCMLEASGGMDQDASYSPFPCVPFAADLEALPGKLPEYAPVSKKAVQDAMLTEGALSDETKAVIVSLRRAMQDKRPLPLSAVDQLCCFVACTQNTLKGGVAEAIDRGVCLYFAPFMRGLGKRMEDVTPLLSAMPRTLKALKK